jgi:hypothetical protein
MNDFNIDYAGQTNIFNPDNFDEVITLIGCGSIGSTLLPLLVTMGFKKFRLYDPDIIDPRNVGASLLIKPDDMYKLKVEVAQAYIEAYGAEEVQVHAKAFELGDALGPVVVTGVDSMEARQVIWQAIQDDGEVQLLLDGRIGGLQFTLLAVEPMDGEWYGQKWLPDDSQIDPLPCAARNVAFVPTALAAEIGCSLARFSRGEQLPHRIDRHFAGDGSFFQVVG